MIKFDDVIMGSLCIIFQLFLSWYVWNTGGRGKSKLWYSTFKLCCFWRDSFGKYYPESRVAEDDYIERGVKTKAQIFVDYYN